MDEHNVIKQAEIPVICPREAVIKTYDQMAMAPKVTIRRNKVKPVAAPLYYDPYAASAEENDRQDRRRRRGKLGSVAFSLVLCFMALCFGFGVAVGWPLAENILIPRLVNEENRWALPFFGANEDTVGIRGVVDRGEFPPEFPFSYADLVDAVKPSVVTITTVTNVERITFGRRTTYRVDGAGTGFIIDATETTIYIVTNAHVIDGAIQVNVSIDGSAPLNAFPVGSDVGNDLAVITVPRVSAQRVGIHSVAIAYLGDSDDMRVGDVVLAIGNSLGDGIVVTDGIISGVNRQITLEGNISLDVLQTNAAINQGNSGGPLVNLHGQVIGVNTAKATGTMSGGARIAVEGTGFAIPSNTVRQIVIRILAGEVAEQYTANPQPRLGISGRSVDEEIKELHGVTRYGAFVIEVNYGDAAYLAGLLPHDLIIAVNGIEITEFEEMRQIIITHRPGDVVELTVLRDGNDEIVLEVVLGAGF